MQEEVRSYRLRTELNKDYELKLPVKLIQKFDFIDVLSLKIKAKNLYELKNSDYGVIIGRVNASGGFGVPNAKISLFLNKDENDKTNYAYNNVDDVDRNSGVRYNLLPKEKQNDCHQNVGTFFSKEKMLSDNLKIEEFDKYWKYSTVTNNSGDYMLFGVPKGMQTIHIDIDLSDIGVLSQTPSDFVYKGYNERQFETYGKFKKDKNLNNLVQVVSQNKGVFVYPYWGEEQEDEFVGLTRCDIDINYKFEPTCIFMGSAISEGWNNAIGKDCDMPKGVGLLRDMVTSEGTIEMIRQTIDGKVEYFNVNGNRLINGDGVWCYQIPMNLDYMVTNEYGENVLTDDITKGIPTRARVRFRMSLNEQGTDEIGRKRARILVPNNPRLDKENYPDFTKTKEIDFEFGTLTKEENYRDLLWNKVYSVKSYIPRTQKGDKIKRKDTGGIKGVEDNGANNPFPYNSMNIDLGFLYIFICNILRIIVGIYEVINQFVLAPITAVLKFIADISILGKHPFGKLYDYIPSCITFDGNFCPSENRLKIYPACFGSIKEVTEERLREENRRSKEKYQFSNKTSQMMSCISDKLGEEYNIVDYNFGNDWVNGVVYMPLWYREILKKKKFLFGLITLKAKDDYCRFENDYSSDTKFFGLINNQYQLVENCSLPFKKDGKIDAINIIKRDGVNETNELSSSLRLSRGVIKSKETMLGEKVYYYSPINFRKDSNQIVLLYATDIICLGSVKPEKKIDTFHECLDSTTFNLPPRTVSTNIVQINDGEIRNVAETSGQSWSIKFSDASDDTINGLFYSVTCNDEITNLKTCGNLRRICELGVSLDTKKNIINYKANKDTGDSIKYESLFADGVISKDEIYLEDYRSMFAIMNNKPLKAKVKDNSFLYYYDFDYMYLNNFDGQMKDIMKDLIKRERGNISYKNNWRLENKSEDYSVFRYGKNKKYYNSNKENDSFIITENSFYFYFGLKYGKTALDVFRQKFYVKCGDDDNSEFIKRIEVGSNDVCLNNKENERNSYVLLDLNGIEAPYTIRFTNYDLGGEKNNFVLNALRNEKIFIGLNDNLEEDIKNKITKEKYYDVIKNNDTIKALINGNWGYEIIDSNGEVMSDDFSLISESIDFNLETIDFEVDEEYLSYYYHLETYEKIAKYNESTLISSEGDKIRDIGGLLKISNLNKSGKKITNNYKIIVNSVDLLNSTEKGEYNGVEIKNGVNNSLENVGILDIIDDKELGQIFYIGLPKSKEKYIVKVIELCDDEETDNVVTKVVYVDESKKLKFFINNIDYDIIRNFNSGWVINNNTLKANIEQLSGWNDLFNVGLGKFNYIGLDYRNFLYDRNASVYSYETITFLLSYFKRYLSTENIGPYEWTEEYKLSNVKLLDKYINMGEEVYENSIRTNPNNVEDEIYNEALNSEVIERELSSIVDDIRNTLEKRVEFIKNVYKEFSILEKGEEKSIVLRAEGGTKPYNFYIRKTQEAYDELLKRNILKDNNSDTYFNSNIKEEDKVLNIALPTLLKNNDYEYTFHNKELNLIKKPYYVMVSDLFKRNMPNIQGNGNSIDKMFPVHIIDNIIKMKSVIIKGMKNVPYYSLKGLLTDRSKRGGFINIDGFGVVGFSNIFPNDLLRGGKIIEKSLLNNDALYNSKINNEVEEVMFENGVIICYNNSNTKLNKQYANFLANKKLNKVISFDNYDNKISIDDGITNKEYIIQSSSKDFEVSDNTIHNNIDTKESLIEFIGNDEEEVYWAFEIIKDNGQIKGDYLYNNVDIFGEFENVNLDIINNIIEEYSKKDLYEISDNKIEKDVFYNYFTKITKRVFKDRVKSKNILYLKNEVEEGKEDVYEENYFGLKPSFKIDFGKKNYDNVGVFFIKRGKYNTFSFSPVYDFTNINASVDIVDFDNIPHLGLALDFDKNKMNVNQYLLNYESEWLISIKLKNRTYIINKVVGVNKNEFYKIIDDIQPYIDEVEDISDKIKKGEVHLIKNIEDQRYTQYNYVNDWVYEDVEEEPLVEEGYQKIEINNERKYSFSKNEYIRYVFTRNEIGFPRKEVFDVDEDNSKLLDNIEHSYGANDKVYFEYINPKNRERVYRKLKFIYFEEKEIGYNKDFEGWGFSFENILFFRDLTNDLNAEEIKELRDIVSGDNKKLKEKMEIFVTDVTKLKHKVDFKYKSIF